MKVAFFSETTVEGKLPRNFENARTEIAWAITLDAPFFPLNKLPLDKKFDLGNYQIKSIILNAQQQSDKFHFHDHRQYKYSLVGFLTPEWEKEWGGELQVEDTTIQFKPGSFVLFSGSDLHDAMPVKINLPFWRISVGIFLN